MQKRQTLMREIGQVRRAWNDHVRKIALSEGIPDSYRSVIMFLHRNPGSSQKTIAEFAGVTTSAINQVVKNMLDDAYLRKETDPSDKRNSRLYLTDNGIHVAHRLWKRLDESDNTITSFIGNDHEQELMDLLHQLTEFIQKEL